MTEPTSKPQLYVISGANGAGKSSFADILVPQNTLIVNPDKIRQEFSNIFQADLFSKNLLNKAILERRNISLETNFLFENDMEDFLSYRNSGYELNMYFIAIRDLEESRQRVETRVSNGGHFVDDYTRELNFNIGKTNSIKYSSYFDRVTVLSNSYELQDFLLHAENRNILYKNETSFQWANDLIRSFQMGLSQIPDISHSQKR